MVDHKIDHKYPKLLSIPRLNTTYDRVWIPTATVIGTLDPVEIESTKVSNISWTKTGTSQDDMRNSPTELPTIPPESRFQLEHNESNRQSIILQDVQVPQEARGKLSSLLENEFDSTISKSSTDIGRTYSKGYTNLRNTNTMKTISNSPRVPKFIDEEICLLEDAGCICGGLSPWAAPVIKLPKKPDPLHAKKQQLHLALNYHLLNMSIDAVCNGNNSISYYPLPNITDLLARLQKCKLFSSLDLRSGYHHIGLTPEVKPKMAFATTNGKWHWNVAPFGICSLPGILCYLMSQISSCLNFCFMYLNDILIYSISWEEYLQHLQIFLTDQKLEKLKIKLRKCQFFKHLHYLWHFISEQGIQPLPETS